MYQKIVTSFEPEQISQLTSRYPLFREQCLLLRGEHTLTYSPLGLIQIKGENYSADLLVAKSTLAGKEIYLNPVVLIQNQLPCGLDALQMNTFQVTDPYLRHFRGTAVLEGFNMPDHTKFREQQLQALGFPANAGRSLDGLLGEILALRNLMLRGRF